MNTGNSNSTNKKAGKKKPSGIYLLAGALLVGAIAIAVLKGVTGSSAPTAASAAQKGGDMTVIKSQITATATFIPYQSGSTTMEVIAVKAPDGTVRTAFNTCQVCYSSGRGYYVQQGDTLVCQNCGNVFKISQIEKEKNGCNPVPILESDKTDDGKTITIPARVLAEHTGLFLKWKR